MDSHSSFYVYIIECSDQTYYTGIAKDLTQRIKEHNGQLKGGAKYTRGKGPVILRYSEEYKTRSEALKREAEIKKMERAQKELIIKSGQ